MSQLLHDLTHRVPGVPAHDASSVREDHQGRANPTHRNPRRDAHQHGEPRVLVAWQNTIARLVSSRTR